MTIIANQINFNPTTSAFTCIAVADSKVTQNGKHHSIRKKLFQIPKFKGTVSYFGLAETGREYFSSWIPRILSQLSSSSSFPLFVQAFMDKLNSDVNKSLLEKYPSGFHICGKGQDNIPEFYFVRNINRMNGIYYSDFQKSYYLSEDYKSRDYKEVIKQAKIPGVVTLYRYYANGDLQTFRPIWDHLTKFAIEIESNNNFMVDDLEEAKWKLKVIGSFYSKFAKNKTVGGKIDGFLNSF